MSITYKSQNKIDGGAACTCTRQTGELDITYKSRNTTDGGATWTCTRLTGELHEHAQG